MKKTVKELMAHHEHLVEERKKQIKKIAGYVLDTGVLPPEYKEQLEKITKDMEMLLAVEVDLSIEKKNKQTVYFYQVACGEYEDYQEEVLIHTKEYTEQEFVTIYNDVVEAIDFSFRPALHEIVDEMVEKYGFQTLPIKFTVWNENLDYSQPLTIKNIKK